MTSVDIIIPSLNSPRIDRVLAAIENQEGIEQVGQIIVVGKDDPGLIPAASGAHLLDSGVPVRASIARNMGIAASEADLFIFIDSDCLAEPGWLREHLAAHQAGQRVVSGGVVAAGHNYWHLTYNLTLFHEWLDANQPGPRDFLATLNLSVERSVIDEVGGMDESVDRVEDVDWTTRMRRAGIQPYFWPAAAVWHDHNRHDLGGVWRDCALSGHHMRRLRLRHADLLQAPGLLRFPKLVLALSPFIAAWATARILWHRPYFLRRFLPQIPAIYLTKIAWCWGAATGSP